MLHSPWRRRGERRLPVAFGTASRLDKRFHHPGGPSAPAPGRDGDAADTTFRPCGGRYRPPDRRL